MDINPQAALWAGVINRLALAYPASPYSHLGKDEVLGMAAVWADDMREIPAEAIEPLYRRTVRDCTSGFAPSLGEFRAAWNAWDYWAEVNTDIEAKAPVLALPEPPRNADSPGAAGYLLQAQLFAVRGQFVTCECANLETGIYDTAVLNRDKTAWVCAGSEGRRCSFSWPVENGKDAPRRQRLPHRNEGKRGAAPVEVAPPRASADGAKFLVAARKCELNVDEMEVEQYAKFRRWVVWFEQKYTCPMNYDLLVETWPVLFPEAAA